MKTFTESQNILLKRQLLIPTLLRKDERQIKYGLELRKKDAQINAIKSFNDFSKKIQPTNKNKPTDKLSDAEKKIIKSLSK